MTSSPLLRAAEAGIDNDRLYAANAAAAAFYATLLPGHGPALAYLRQRGIAEAAGPDPPWQLGYAPPGWCTLVDHLRGDGFDDDELYAAGLATHGRRGQLLDRFRDRLAFPVHDQHGQIIGFTVRDLSGDPDAPKYLNTPETAVYRKSRQLYGLGVQLQHRPPGSGTPLAVVVEGASDMLAVWRMASSIAARPDAVPIYPVSTCGTALTADQLRLLRDTLPAGTRLAVAFDGDPAGRRAFTRAYPLLRTWPGKTYTIALPGGRDPAELLATLGPTTGLAELARRLVPSARAALTATLERLHTDQVITDPSRYPTDRQRAIQAIAGYFLDDPADTPALARAAGKRLRLSDTDLVKEVIAHTFAGIPDAPETWARASAKGRRWHQTGATATHTHPSTWRQAWALADGIGDRPHAAEAATHAAQTAAQVAARSTAAAGVAAAGAAVGELDYDGDAALITATVHPTDAGVRYELAWAGNARAYTVHDGRLVQVTADHTVAQQRRDTGQAVPAGSELEHLLTASARRGPVGRATVDVATGGALLLCTAGLYHHVDPAHLRQALGPVRDPHATTHRLIAKAAAGGDSATALLLHTPAKAAGGAGGPADLARLASAAPLTRPGDPTVVPPPPAAGRATTAEVISYLRSLVTTANRTGPSHPRRETAPARRRR